MSHYLSRYCVLDRGYSDISPCLKGRGFPFSRMGFPVSWDVAHKSWTWVSYTSSAGLTSPEPQGRSGLSFRPPHSYSNRCVGNWKGGQAKSTPMPLPCHSDAPFIPKAFERGLLARGVVKSERRIIGGSLADTQEANERLGQHQEQLGELIGKYASFPN
jgi:hypothetical protein